MDHIQAERALGNLEPRRSVTCLALGAEATGALGGISASPSRLRRSGTSQNRTGHREMGLRGLES